MTGLHKEIGRLALPSILANITVPLVGLADVAIAGHLTSAASRASSVNSTSIPARLTESEVSSGRSMK